MKHRSFALTFLNWTAILILSVLLGCKKENLDAFTKKSSTETQSENAYHYTVIAGKEWVSGFKDGLGTDATFCYPGYIAVNADRILVSSSRYGIRSIDTLGSVTTPKLSQDGGLAIAPDGTIFFAESYNYRIRKINKDGTITTLAGGSYGDDDGQGSSAKFGRMYGLKLSPSGDLFVFDTFQRKTRLRKISEVGDVTTVAGGGSLKTFKNPLDIKIFPSAMTIGKDGTVYFVNKSTGRIMQFKDGVLAFHASGYLMSYAHTGTIDDENNLYFAHYGGGFFFVKITPEGDVSLIGDQNSLSYRPSSLAFYNNSIYFTDGSKHVVGKIILE